jgi:hypothetical protein
LVLENGDFVAGWSGTIVCEEDGVLMSCENCAAGVNEGCAPGGGGDIDGSVVGCGKGSVGGNGSLADVCGEESSFNLHVDGWCYVGCVNYADETWLGVCGDIFASSEEGSEGERCYCGDTEGEWV